MVKVRVKVGRGGWCRVWCGGLGVVYCGGVG